MSAAPQLGDVLRFYPVHGSPRFRRIRVTHGPYDGARGEKVVRGYDLRDYKTVVAALRYLTADDDAAPLPPSPYHVGGRAIYAPTHRTCTIEMMRREGDVVRLFVRLDSGTTIEAPVDYFLPVEEGPVFRRAFAWREADEEPAPNGPADLGWNEQSVTRGPRPERRAVTFEIPAGTSKRSCRSCSAPVFWIVTAAGKRMPVNPDGTSHFSSCPNAAQHRRAR